jgi:OmpA-OmpF porin, OOP family
MIFLVKKILLICISVTCFQTQALTLVKVTYSSDVYFLHEDEKILDVKQLDALDQLISKTKQIHLEIVMVVGHADPSESNSLALSNARAEQVKLYLAKNGIEKNRIYIEGKGAQQPLGSASKLNRRVEVVVVGVPNELIQLPVRP